MSIGDKKKQFSRPNPKPNQAAAKNSKDLPKPVSVPDKSIFAGKPYMETRGFRWQLKDQKYFNPTKGMNPQQRDDLAVKLFGAKQYIKKSDIEKAEKQIDLGKWSKYKKDFSPKEKDQAKRFIRTLLGK